MDGVQRAKFKRVATITTTPTYTQYIYISFCFCFCLAAARQRPHRHRLHVPHHHQRPSQRPPQAPLACPQHHSSHRCSSKWLPLLEVSLLAPQLATLSATVWHRCSAVPVTRRLLLQPPPPPLPNSHSSPITHSRPSPMSLRAPVHGRSNSSCSVHKVNPICRYARDSMRHCDSAKFSIICSREWERERERARSGESETKKTTTITQATTQTTHFPLLDKMAYMLSCCCFLPLCSFD